MSDNRNTPKPYKQDEVGCKFCPVCGDRVEHFIYVFGKETSVKYNYCKNCGQRIYWGENRDAEVVKVFISQPMKGRTDAEIIKEREEIINELNVDHKYMRGKKIYEAVDSFIVDAPKDAKPLWMFGKSLEYLSEADMAYFVKGWNNARGCRLEWKACREYGIPIFENGIERKDLQKTK